MKDIHNNPLFTDMNAEEEVSVQGGAVPIAIWAAIAAPTVVGFFAAIGSAIGWSFKDSNGLVIGDKKNTWSDGFRWGKGTQGDKDLPNGWTWGIKDNGGWVAGGYGKKLGL